MRCVSLATAVPLGAFAAVSLVASPGAADEAIARRLAALHSLVEPEAAHRALDRARSADPACPISGNVWWRMSELGERSRIDRAIRDASLRFGIDPKLVRTVIHFESNFDVEAVSSKGALGLMQLMPATARELGVVCAFDPRENVMAGVRYLRRLHARLGSWPRALAGYHAGPGRVERGRIPGITRRYVRSIIASWRPGLLAWIDLD